MTALLRFFACITLAVSGLSAQAESGRFSQGVALGDAGIDLRVAAAVFRSDARWLTLGSRFDAENRETPYLVLRDAGGAQRASVAIAADSGRSWAPRSMIDAGGGHVIVFGLEYDHADFSAPQGLFLARLDADLQPVWSRHVEMAQATIENAALRAQTDGPPIVVGGIQPLVEGIPAAGDAFFATLNVATGGLDGAWTLGTPDAHERAADAVPFASGQRALLLEVRRGESGGMETGDGLIALDASGAIASSHLSGHAVSAGIRTASMRLIDDGSGLVVAGRRTAFGPNFFYLQRLAADLAPAATRTLIPFFNVADVATAPGGGTLLYGEANGEVQDRGTVLMRLDGDLAIDLQRRYGTQNQVFPSGAIARGDGGLLLALGAMREDDALVFESVNRVNADDGEGLLCEETDYVGFSTAIDDDVAELSWNPAVAALDIASVAVAANVQTLTRGGIGECATQDDLVFRDRFDP